MGRRTLNPKPIVNTRGGPERQVQDALIRFLRERGWVVKETHGNLFQTGFPDLYAAHRMYGARWIETKIHRDGIVKFENSQLEFFPQLASVGVGVWVLVAATEEEYRKLFKESNWWQYLSVSQPHKTVRLS